MLVACRNESFKGGFFGGLDNFGDLFGKAQLVPPQILFQVFSSHHAHDPCHLIVVIRSLEERVNIEKHTGKGAPKRPNVQRVVIFPVLDEEFWSFVVSAGDADVVLLLGLVEVGEAPVDDSEVALVVVNHDVERLYITMHDSV